MARQGGVDVVFFFGSKVHSFGWRMLAIGSMRISCSDPLLRVITIILSRSVLNGMMITMKNSSGVS